MKNLVGYPTLAQIAGDVLEHLALPSCVWKAGRACADARQYATRVARMVLIGEDRDWIPSSDGIFN